MGTGRPLRDHEEENRSVIFCSLSPSPSPAAAEALMVQAPLPMLKMTLTISMPTPLPIAVRPVLKYEDDVDLSSASSFHFPLHSSWPSFYRVRSFFLSSLSHTASHDSAYVNTYGHSCTHLHRHFASQRFSLFATHLSVYQTSMTTAHRQRPLLQIHSFLFQRCHLLQLSAQLQIIAQVLKIVGALVSLCTFAFSFSNYE